MGNAVLKAEAGSGECGSGLEARVDPVDQALVEESGAASVEPLAPETWERNAGETGHCQFYHRC
jgi:hypothetical protein